MRNAAVDESRVVDAPPYMVGRVVAKDGDTMYCEAMISHLVEETDPLFQEWASFLRQFCFVVDSIVEFEDENWMMGGGIHRKSRAFNRCPGADVDHFCISDRATVPMNFTGKV